MKQTQMKQAEYMISLQMDLVKKKKNFVKLVNCHFLLFQELQILVFLCVFFLQLESRKEILRLKGLYGSS